MSNPRRRFCSELKLEAVRRVQETNRPNSIWMSDIRFILTGEGWAYLAAAMDLCTRKIVGRSLKDMLRTEVALEAFDRAAIESFFQPLKVERANWKKCRTKQEAVEDLNSWIGSWYNPKRLYSSLGCMSPNEYGTEKNVA